jgi:hypothetical protein
VAIIPPQERQRINWFTQSLYTLMDGFAGTLRPAL